MFPLYQILDTVGELPTFAQRTIIGLERFHFCVRNGNRWSTLSIAPLHCLQSLFILSLSKDGSSHELPAKTLHMLIISTSRLHPLRGFHLKPINLVVSEGSMNPHLGGGFALRCFQRLSCPNLATQLCSWRNNWYTRGWFAEVLSYCQQLSSRF